MEVNGSCVQCHPECLRQTGSLTCSGPVSAASTAIVAIVARRSVQYEIASDSQSIQATVTAADFSN